MADQLKAGERPDVIVSPFGTHRVCYGDNDEDGYGPYAVVCFYILEAVRGGWFTEIDDGVYGNLRGFRIYFNELDDGRGELPDRTGTADDYEERESHGG